MQHISQTILKENKEVLNQIVPKRGGHWGVPNTAIPQKISINTVIPQKKSANIAIPHQKSMKYRNRKNVVYYSHYALKLTRIAWFRI